MSLKQLPRRLSRSCADEAGQTLIEYAVLALLISIAAVILMSAIGLDIAEWFDAIENVLGLGADNTVDATPGTDDATAPTGVVN